MNNILQTINKVFAKKCKNHFQTKEQGFSLLELVVAIGILLILTVGGLIGYSAITNNARTASANAAAAEVSTAIIVALNDNEDNNNAPYSGEDGGWVPKFSSVYPDVNISVTPFSANASEYELTVTHKKQKAPENSIVKKIKP